MNEPAGNANPGGATQDGDTNATAQPSQEADIKNLRQENDALKVEIVMLKQTIADQERRLVEYSWMKYPDRMGG
jgi:cell division protein FtsB